MTTAMIAGGFDPIHPGHISLFRKAKSIADRVVVVAESDEWIIANKHRPLLSHSQRVAMLSELRCVDEVIAGQGVVGCGYIIRDRKPDFFVVGKDHVDATTIPEAIDCQMTGTEIVRLDSEDESHSSKLLSDAGVAFHSRNMPVAASAIIVAPGGVLLGRRAGDRTSGQWALIGGFVENGESLEDALRREVREELSVEIAEAKYLFSHVGKYHDGRNVLSPYFVCTISGSPKASPELCEFMLTTHPMQLAFESDTEALRHYFSTRGR